MPRDNVVEEVQLDEEDIRFKTLLQNWHDNINSIIKFDENYYSDTRDNVYNESSSSISDFITNVTFQDLTTAQQQNLAEEVFQNGYTDRNGVFLEGFDAFFSYVDDYNDRLALNLPSSLRAFANKMRLVLDDNQNGIGKSSEGNNISQFFNKNRQYTRGNGLEPISGLSTSAVVRSLDNQGEITISNAFSTTTKNLSELHEIVAQPAILLGTRIDSVPTNSDVVEELLSASNNFKNVGVGETADNIFSIAGGGNYIYRWYDQSQRNSVDLMTETELSDAAQGGWTVGQILGDEFVPRRGPDFWNFLSGTFEDFLLGIAEESSVSPEAAAEARLLNAKVAVYDKFVPGLQRINFPFNVPVKLDILLNQNLLLPTYHPAYDANLNIFTKEDKTFLQIYSSYNRTRENPDNPQEDDTNYFDPTRFAHGYMAGVPILDIERQASLKPGESPPEDYDIQILDFVEHDFRFLRNDQLERGFKSNIGGTIGFSFEGEQVDVDGAGALVPAVEDFTPPLPGEKDTPAEEATSRSQAARFNSYAMGKAQFFPFIIESTNKNVSGSTQETRAYFQATISSITETSNPSWTPKTFFGRTEQIHTYTMTDRNLDVAFIIHADTMRDIANVKHRVNFLLQQTYGQYETIGSQSRITAGPLLRITIGDLYVGIPGFITSLTVNWNNPAGGGPMWEMTRGLMMPKICSINMSYKILHDNVPDRKTDFYEALQAGIDGEHDGRGPSYPDERSKISLIPTANILVSGASNTNSDQSNTDNNVLQVPAPPPDPAFRFDLNGDLVTA